MRGRLLIILLVLCISGCGGNKIARLERENQALKEQVEELSRQLESVSEGVHEVQKIEGETRRMVLNIEQQMQERQAEEAETVEETSLQEERVVRPPRIKVLSGTKGLTAARTLVRKLMDAGYAVEKMDRAPRTNFKSNVVYFGQDFEGEAKSIVEALGGRTSIRPMTWPSIFDIIVVAGRR